MQRSGMCSQSEKPEAKRVEHASSEMRPERVFELPKLVAAGGVNGKKHAARSYSASRTAVMIASFEGNRIHPFSATFRSPTQTVNSPPGVDMTLTLCSIECELDSYV